MSGYRVVFIQSGAGGAAAAAQASPDVQIIRVQPQSIGEQIRTEVQKSVQAATQDAAASREIQQAVRDAERHVRDAQRQLREARTDDQRGAARQELMGAEAELQALRNVPSVLVHTSTGTGEPVHFPSDGIPPQVVDVFMGLFIMVAVIVIGWPLARAFGRRLERGVVAPAAPDPALAGQLQRIEQAVEAMSIEIERISESQRFMAKLQNGASPERAALGAAERR